MPTDLLVIGAGGHAKVVIEAVLKGDKDCHIILVDHDMGKVGMEVLGNIPIKVLENWAELPAPCHAAVGNNRVRRQLSTLAQEHGRQPFTVVHPDASISTSAYLGDGSFLAAKSVVSSEARIGEGCIVNHGAIIDHDCCIEDYSHIAPNATLGGEVRVRSGALVGAGAVILPGVRIGKDAVIGAGAVVTCDVKDNVTVAGVPARVVQT